MYKSLEERSLLPGQQGLAIKGGSDGNQVWSVTLIYDIMQESRNIYSSRVI